MKTKIKIIASTMLLTAALIVTSCNNAQKSENTEKQQTQEVAQAKKYQCPMKCEGDKTYDKPGKCPKCGMDLKEVKE